MDDKRLFIKESEFASVLKKMTRDGNSLSALLRDAWDSTHLQVLTRKDPLRATGAHVSLVTHVTREELRALMTATEQANGLANRFLWALVHRTKKLPHGGQLKGDSEELLSLISRVRSAVDRATDRGLIEWAPAAKCLYGHVYGPLSDGLSGVLGKVTSRAEAQVTRLALLYALLDGTVTIEFEHLTAALAGWRFCLESARAIFGDGTGSKLADRFLAEMKLQGPEGLVAPSCTSSPTTTQAKALSIKPWRCSRRTGWRSRSRDGRQGPRPKCGLPSSSSQRAKTTAAGEWRHERRFDLRPARANQPRRSLSRRRSR